MLKFLVSFFDAETSYVEMKPLANKVPVEKLKSIRLFNGWVGEEKIDFVL